MPEETNNAPLQSEQSNTGTEAQTANAESQTRKESETATQEQAPEQKATTPVTPEDYEQEKKQWAGKIQKLQEENNRYNQVFQGVPLEQAEYLFKTGMTMESLASQSPEFKDRLIELVDKANKGELTKKEEKELVDKQQQVKEESTSAPTPQDQWVQSKMKEERQKRESFITELEGEEKTDIDKNNFWDPSVGRMRNLTREAIAINAERLKRESGMSEEDAYRTAFNIVRHPEKIKEEGILEGMSTALEGGQKTGSISGGKSEPETSITVPEHMKEGYEYRLKTKGKEAADSYVKWRMEREKV